MLPGANKQSELKQRIALKTREQELEDLRYLLGVPQFRRFYVRVIEMCFENRTSFTGNAQTYFNEGMRNVSLLLKKDIEEMGILGLDLKQAAEREAVINQMEIQAQVESQFKQNIGGTTHG